MNEWESEFCKQYMIKMIQEASELPDSISEKMMRNCAICHYEMNKMDDLLTPMINNPEEFFRFLESEWGWIIQYDKEKGIVIANENKKECVCPIVNLVKEKKVADTICYCSEGFLGIMFKKVFHKEVTVTIVKSIQRGDDSCVYQINL